jgi:hypothetical protein
MRLRNRLRNTGITRFSSVVYSLPSLSTAKFDGDSRTASMGGRTVSGGSLIITGGYGAAFNMAGLIQTVCGNKWLLKEGFQHAIGASTTLAQRERSLSNSIATVGNPAQVTTGGITDNQYSVGSDGVATILTQSGNHIFSCAVGVNDNSGSPATYYNSPSTASQTLATIASIADAIGVAGKVWYVGNEFPRGDGCFVMESKTVSGGTCTATNTTNFVDGETFGAVGVVGVFATGAPRPLVKVGSSPIQDQYTVTSGGLYTFGGTAPTTAYITYNASPSGGRTATYDQLRIIKEFMESSSSNFTSSVNSVNYGIPGLQYNRPWVRVADTFAATVDSATGASQLPKPGQFDNLQLHGNILAAYRTAVAFKTKFDADYPSAESIDQRPTRNNWYAARGTGSGTTFSGTLPSSMCVGFTSTNAPTLIAINGIPIGKVDTSSGAITGTGITSGTLNYTTGAWSITFAVATTMAANNQLWFEQDIGNYDLTTMAEGTIGRNAVNNGLLDMTAASGTNLTTTTGTSSISGIAGSSIPYGWTLSNAAMATAVTNGTASVSVASETDSNGYPRFVVEASGSHTATTSLQLGSGAINSISGRITAGDGITAGAQARYSKHSTIGRFYGCTGIQCNGNMVTTSLSRNSSTGSQSVTSLTTRSNDGGTGMYIDDSLLDESGGAFDAYRVTPILNTTGSSLGATQVNLIMTTAATVPFSYRFGLGRAQLRRRNDV